MFKLENNIQHQNLISVFQRYKALTDIKWLSFSTEYYKRQENFWSFIFDHLFLVLANKLESLEEDHIVFKWIKKAINQCHTDYKNHICVNKTKLNLSNRTYKISNIYNIIYYECFASKLIDYLREAFEYDKNTQCNQLNKYLIDWKYFGYAHRIDFTNKWYKVENYIDWWLEFEKEKDLLLKSKEFYIEFDVTDFYDSIDHQIFTDLLKSFFDRYSNFSDIDKFLSSFHDALFKVNGYEKKWLPQWLLWSDILSTIFLWLLINHFNSELWTTNINGKIETIQTDLHLIFYADDFIIFWDNSEEISKFLTILKSILNKNKIAIHWNNDLLFISECKLAQSSKIDFWKIKKDDVLEIKLLIDDFLFELEKTDLWGIDFWKVKKYFRWIWKINKISISEKTDLLKRLKKILIWKPDIHKARKLFWLLGVSVKNYIFLLSELINSWLVKQSEIIKIYWKYGYLIADWTHEIFHLCTDDINNIAMWELDKKIQELRLTQTFFTGLNKKKLLKKELKIQWLQELESFMYNRKKCEKYEENILWIKLHSLFNIDKSLVHWLWLYIFNQNSKNSDLFEYLQKLSYDLVWITDSLILIKNIKPTFYLQDASFIADLYSLFNILLSLGVTLKRNRKFDVNIMWNGLENIWKVQLQEVGKSKKDKIDILEIDSQIESIKYILFYITKFRAELNHKEKLTDWKSDINVFIKLKEREFFFYSIKDAINNILKLIEKSSINQ